MITSARVKQYFGTLKKKKKGKDGVFGVDESEAISQGRTCKHGGVREMKALIKTRNIVVVGGLSRLNKPALEQMLIDADNGLADGDEWAADNAASELGCDAASANWNEVKDCIAPVTALEQNLHEYSFEELLQGLSEEGGVEKAMEWAR